MTSPFALYAFHVLESRLLHRSQKYGLAKFKQVLGAESTEVDSPLFVTWNLEGELRGCIGTFAPLDVEQGVAEYSLIAAMEDHRFNPIHKSEFHSLSVDITLLQDFEQAKDVHDWQLGTHGIRIKFKHQGRLLSGTFLPSVAVEQGWNKDQTLKRLVQKAGGDYHTVDWDQVDLVRYLGVKSGIDYDGYKSFMKQYDLESEL